MQTNSSHMRESFLRLEFYLDQDRTFPELTNLRATITTYPTPSRQLGTVTICCPADVMPPLGKDRFNPLYVQETFLSSAGKKEYKFLNIYSTKKFSKRNGKEKKIKIPNIQDIQEQLGKYYIQDLPGHVTC